MMLLYPYQFCFRTSPRDVVLHLLRPPAPCSLALYRRARRTESTCRMPLPATPRAVGFAPGT